MLRNVTLDVAGFMYHHMYAITSACTVTDKVVSMCSEYCSGSCSEYVISNCVLLVGNGVMTHFIFFGDIPLYFVLFLHFVL
jgi:hypothetical protein